MAIIFNVVPENATFIYDEISSSNYRNDLFSNFKLILLFAIKLLL
jgi:hypothetical protein